MTIEQEIRAFIAREWPARDKDLHEAALTHIVNTAREVALLKIVEKARKEGQIAAYEEVIDDLKDDHECATLEVEAYLADLIGDYQDTIAERRVQS